MHQVLTLELGTLFVVPGLRVLFWNMLFDSIAYTNRTPVAHQFCT